MIDIHKYDRIAFDTETTGLVYPRDKAFGLSIATPDNQSHYWDFRVDPAARMWAAKELPRYQGKLIAHNASFDVRMLASAGIMVPMTDLEDTVVRAVMIDENHQTVYPWSKGRMSYRLDDLAQYYMKERKDQQFYEDARRYFGSPNMSQKMIMSRIAELPPELVGRYAKQDAVVTLRLWDWQEKEIERQDVRKICDFEKSVMPTLIRAEMRGIRVDRDRTEQAIIKVDAEIDKKQKQLNELAGGSLNVNSPKQLKEFFNPKQDSSGTWIANDGTPIGSTDKGQPSFAGEFLKEMVHPAAGLIDDIKSLRKTSGTFLKGHILGHMVNDHVYPTINQTASEEGGTRTGRLSYTKPAMQQIPSRNKAVAAIIKPCFLPPEGMVWVDADMQSFEVRVFAHLVSSFNTALLEAYAADPKTDFHQYVADLTGLERNATYSGQPNAKQLNLSMIFNSGNGAIAHKMGMDWAWDSFKDSFTGDAVKYRRAGPEALKVINLYHSRVGGVKTLADKAKLAAEKHGYVRTGYGRKLRFRRGFKSYKASGLLIQGTAGDINKENWPLIEQALDGAGHLMLNTHDSYSMAMPENWKPHYENVREALERPALRVPLILDLNGVGRNWWEALQGFE